MKMKTKVLKECYETEVAASPFPRPTSHVEQGTHANDTRSRGSQKAAATS